VCTAKVQFAPARAFDETRMLMALRSAYLIQGYVIFMPLKPKESVEMLMESMIGGALSAVTGNGMEWGAGCEDLDQGDNFDREGSVLRGFKEELLVGVEPLCVIFTSEGFAKTGSSGSARGKETARAGRPAEPRRCMMRRKGAKPGLRRLRMSMLCR
jgi:hypothetical protein